VEAWRRGGVDVQYLESSPRHFMEVSDQFHASVASSPIEPPAPTAYEVGWFSELVLTVCNGGKSLVQPEVHRYTD
jgi:hypothetical protein